VNVNFNEFLFADGDLCEEFYGLPRVSQSRIGIEFIFIFRLGSNLPDLKSYLFNDSIFDEVGKICESGDIMSIPSR
jgi:hypothetical protein